MFTMKGPVAAELVCFYSWDVGVLQMRCADGSVGDSASALATSEA